VQKLPYEAAALRPTGLFELFLNNLSGNSKSAPAAHIRQGRYFRAFSSIV